MKDTKDTVHNEHLSYRPLIGVLKSMGLGLTICTAVAGIAAGCIWVYELVKHFK